MQQDELLRFTAGVLERLAVRYALVGSFASGIWGEARFTQDIDIVVDLRPEHAAPLCNAFPRADFYASRAAVDEAIREKRPFNVIHPQSGNKIDFMVQGDVEWQRGQLQRAVIVSLGGGTTIQVASPADVIVGKLVYYQEGGSDKHLRDIQGILKLSGDLVDCPYVDRQAAGLGVVAVWNEIKGQC